MLGIISPQGNKQLLVCAGYTFEFLTNQSAMNNPLRPNVAVASSSHLAIPENQQTVINTSAAT